MLLFAMKVERLRLPLAVIVFNDGLFDAIKEASGAHQRKLLSQWILRAQLIFGIVNGSPRGGSENELLDIGPRIRLLRPQ